MAFLCARGQTSGNAYQFLWFCSISAIDSSSFYMLIFNPNITDGKYTHNPSEPMHHWLRPLFSIVSSSLSSSEFMLVFRKLGNSKLYNWPLRNRRTDKKNRTARHVKWRESFIKLCDAFFLWPHWETTFSVQLVKSTKEQSQRTTATSKCIKHCTHYCFDPFCPFAVLPLSEHMHPA